MADVIVRIEAVAERESQALREDERDRLQAAVDAALPGRKVYIVIGGGTDNKPYRLPDPLRVVEAVAEAHGMRSAVILGGRREHKVSAARHEAWWLLEQDGMTVEAIADAFDRTKQTVSEALVRFRAQLEIDAELRARMTWAAAERRRSAS